MYNLSYLTITDRMCMFRPRYTARARGILGHQAAWPRGHPHMRTLGVVHVRRHLCDSSAGPFSVSAAISHPPLGPARRSRRLARCAGSGRR